MAKVTLAFDPSGDCLHCVIAQLVSSYGRQSPAGVPPEDFWNGIAKNLALVYSDILRQCIIPEQWDCTMQRIKKLAIENAIAADKLQNDVVSIVDAAIASYKPGDPK